MNSVLPDLGFSWFGTLFPFGAIIDSLFVIASFVIGLKAIKFVVRL